MSSGVWCVSRTEWLASQQRAVTARTRRRGEIVSLMSADVQNILTGVAFFHWTWGPLLQLAVTLALLSAFVRAAAAAALAVLLLTAYAQVG